MKKQETLEETAENESEYLADYEDKEAYQKAFIEGAKYQSERMYSEEEVEKMVRAAYTFGEKEFKYFGAFKEWFKQFKKK
jgi:hypothetical protein